MVSKSHGCIHGCLPDGVDIMLKRKGLLGLTNSSTCFTLLSGLAHFVELLGLKPIGKVWRA